MRRSSTTPFYISSRPRIAQSRVLCFRNTSAWLISRSYEPHRSRSSSTKTSGNDRTRLSRLWSPSGGLAPGAEDDSHSKLVRAGFLRQAHSGIFHVLPLGRRVLDKLEVLIDKHMSTLDASKLDLSSISSESLWEKSGRLKSIGSELFRFQDRKEAGYLLSPTHEEEITTLVSNTITSYKDLPVRLYQISRKYRDELRPRHGLLRSREFIMKDLYTFDYSSQEALSTYNQVREAYARLFDELKIPYLVAEADSGDMGGNLSHEFHFPTTKGEDHIISCTSCEYVANEELADGPVLHSEANPPESYRGPLAEVSNLTGEELGMVKRLSSWVGISKDRSTLFNVLFFSSSISSNQSSAGAEGREINLHALKAAFPEVDNSIEDPLNLWAKSIPPTIGHTGPPPKRQILNIVDGSVPGSLRKKFKFADGTVLLGKQLSSLSENVPQINSVIQDPSSGNPFNLLRVQIGDRCPRCSDGHLKISKAIELGHTFHLGSRYTKHLDGHVAVPYDIIKGQEENFEILPEAKGGTSERQVVVQMGCHGIGVSRIIGAVADTLADEKGLNWPRVMAPFEAVIVPSKSREEAAFEVYDVLSEAPRRSEETAIDLVLDDRTKPFPWKLHDADLIGYPVIIVVGRRWAAEQMCEVQCRRLKIKEDIPLEGLADYVHSLLEQL